MEGVLGAGKQFPHPPYHKASEKNTVLSRRVDPKAWAGGVRGAFGQRQGKFEEVEDSDGDTCYYKKELSQTDALELSRKATTGKQKTSSSQVEVEALASAFRSEFQGKGTGSSTDRKPLQNKNKKEKKEAKEETEDEKAQKSLKACLSAMNRHQEKLMVAISKLEKDRAAAGIRQLCVNALQKVKKQQSNLQVLIADYNQKAAAKAIENVTKVSAECADALKKAKPFTG